MEREVQGWTLGELAQLLGAQLAGPPDLRIDGPAPAGSGGSSQLTFARDERFLSLAEGSEVGAVLVGHDCRASSKPLLRAAQPFAAFARFLALCARPLPLQRGIHPTAVVSATAHVDAGASVGAFAVIESHAHIGPGCRVYPFCYVGDGCRLEEDVVLFPHVVLYQDVRIGARTLVHAGVVLGADGFGFVWDGQRQAKVPQVGGVVVGPDCEVGALTAIDRATMGDTVLAEDVKLDDLVMIGHNVRVGAHTVIASQSGIAGSSELGERVVLAGQVGIGDHVRIGDSVILTARTATTNDVLDPGPYRGFPPRPLAEENRILAASSRLPELLKRVRELERRVAELESDDA